MPILSQFFHKIETEGTLPNFFYEVTFTMILKPHKDLIKKGNNRPISLTNIDANILNKTVANQIQEHTKNMIHHDQIGFIPEMRGWFNISKLMNLIHNIKD